MTIRKQKQIREKFVDTSLQILPSIFLIIAIRKFASVKLCVDYEMHITSQEKAQHKIVTHI